MVRPLSRERAPVLRHERDVTLVTPVGEIGGRQPEALRERSVRLDPRERVAAEHGPPQPERAHLSQRELRPRSLRGQ